MAKKQTKVTVNLAFPFSLDGTEYTQLTFRRMKAKDTLVAEGEEDQTRAGFLMFAALAGVDVKVIEELDLADLETVSEEVAPLMGKSGKKALRELKEQA